MSRPMKVKAHLLIAGIENVIEQAIARENANDLYVYPDIALVELCKRAGITDVTVGDVCWFRRRLGYPGTPTRLRQLIKEGQ